MGAAKRTAEVTANFGFHRTAQFADLPEFMAEAFNTGGSDATDYLIERGIPRELVEKAERTPSDGMLYVNAVQFSYDGAVDELTSNRWPVSVEVAKWIWIAERASKHPDHNVRAFAPVASALSGADQAKSGADVSRLYAALVARDEANVRSASLALIQQLAPRVFESAAPQHSHAYLVASTNTMSSIRANGGVSACASVARGKGLLSAQGIPPAVVSAEYGALATAIGSANENGWSKRPIPDSARTEARVVVNRSLVAVANLGLTVDAIETDDTAACNFTLTLLDRVLMLPPDRAISVYRAIVAVGE